MYSEYCAPGVKAEAAGLEIGNGVTLNCITFKNGNPSIEGKTVFIPGFASVIDNFGGILRELTVHNKFVYLVETRDKASSIIPINAGFAVRDIASDISGAIEALDIEEGRYMLISYSLGATASAEAFDLPISRKPALLVLVAPNASFRIPLAGRIVARYFSWLYRPLKPLIKMYIKKFHVDTENDYEMYMISCRALDNADPRKMAPAFLEMARYEIWDSLDKIDVPTIVIGASHDIFHSLNDAMEISSKIRNSKYFDLETNIRTHSAEVYRLITDHPVSFLYLILTGSALFTLFL